MPDERLSLDNPPQGPSYNNFGEFVTALKLQFLQGVPPTPENINRAQQRAELVASQQGINPDAGAQSPAQPNASGGAGGVTVGPSPVAPPSNGLPLDSPPAVPASPLPPVNPNTVPQQATLPDADVLNEVIAGGEEGSGLAGLGGGALVGVAALLAQSYLNRPEQGGAAGREVQRNNLIAPDEPRLGLPAPDRVPSSIVIPQNEQSGRGAIRRGGPDSVLAIEDLERTPVDTSQSDISGDLTGNERAKVTTGGDQGAALGGIQDIPADERARLTAIAEAAVPPGHVPTNNELLAALPRDLSTQGTEKGASSSRPNVELMQNLMDNMFGKGKALNKLTDNERVMLMQAIAVANEATGKANTSAGLTQNAGLELNRAGTQTVEPPNVSQALRRVFGALR